jgi:hypothetical protein
MVYEGVEYVVRASLGRDQWTLLICFPDGADPTVVKFSGLRDEAGAAARRKDRQLDQAAENEKRGEMIPTATLARRLFVPYLGTKTRPALRARYCLSAPRSLTSIAGSSILRRIPSDA